MAKKTAKSNTKPKKAVKTAKKVTASGETTPKAKKAVKTAKKAVKAPSSKSKAAKNGAKKGTTPRASTRKKINNPFFSVYDEKRMGFKYNPEEVLTIPETGEKVKCKDLPLRVVINLKTK